MESSVSDAFKQAIEAALQRKVWFADFCPILEEFRDKGMSATSALAVLQSLRAGADEPTDDLILEVMDIVVGFCSPHLRVWGE